MLAVFAVEVVAGGERCLPMRARPFRGRRPTSRVSGEEVRDERRKTGDVPGSWFLVLSPQSSVLARRHKSLTPVKYDEHRIV
jgi:hypothetical protein